MPCNGPIVLCLVHFCITGQQLSVCAEIVECSIFRLLRMWSPTLCLWTCGGRIIEPQLFNYSPGNKHQQHLREENDGSLSLLDFRSLVSVHATERWWTELWIRLKIPNFTCGSSPKLSSCHCCETVQQQFRVCFCHHMSRIFTFCSNCPVYSASPSTLSASCPRTSLTSSSSVFHLYSLQLWHMSGCRSVTRTHTV